MHLTYNQKWTIYSSQHVTYIGVPAPGTASLVCRVSTVVTSSTSLVCRVIVLIETSTSLVCRTTVLIPATSSLPCTISTVVYSATALRASVYVWRWYKVAPEVDDYTPVPDKVSTWDTDTKDSEWDEVVPIAGATR